MDKDGMKPNEQPRQERTTAGDWSAEDVYWRDNFRSRPYAAADRDYEHYRPAYRYGAESGMQNRGRAFDEAEADLRAGWDRLQDRGQSTWENMKDAVRDAWNRVTNR